jgi:serine protease Do
MRKPNLKTLIFVLVLTVMLAVIPAGCIQIAGLGETTPPATTPTSTGAPVTVPINPTWTPPASGNIGEELPSIADVVAHVKPAVVAITTEVVTYDIFNRPFTQEGAGSGWIIDSSGFVVTNNHVVEDAETITVTTDDGSSYLADVNSIATDPLNDLAVIKIDAQNLPALTVGNTSEMRVGDWVIAIGNALGQGIRATEGIVSRQDVSLQVGQGQTLYDLIETSAAINPGNSGGPLVNLAGEVIGITSAKVADIGVEGMGYAISIDTATPIIQELVNRGYVTRSWLGVGLYTVDPVAVRQLNLFVDEGVLLVEVVAGSPAESAGLQAGDVIVNIGGTDVATVEELTKILHAHPIGQPLEISYWREDQQAMTTAVPIETPRA